MAGLEDELENALVARAAALLDAATTCMAIADMPLDIHPSFQFLRVREAIRELEYAEALTAALFVRCGASWDVLAARSGRSRQALHRRLATKAEETYGEAQSYPDYHQDTLANYCGYVDSFSRGLGDELPDDLRSRAGELASLRRTPHWWRAT